MIDISWAQKSETRKDIGPHIRRFLLYPDFWKSGEQKLISNLNWQCVKFSTNNVNSIPNKNGIYCFAVSPPSDIGLFETRYLLYVGKAATSKLRKRYSQYIDEMNSISIGKQPPRVKVQEVLNLYYGHVDFFYTVMDNKSLIVNSEEILLNTFMPYANTSIPIAKISEELRHIY